MVPITFRHIFLTHEECPEKCIVVSIDLHVLPGRVITITEIITYALLNNLYLYTLVKTKTSHTAKIV